MTDNDNCGWPTASGDACRNPATGDDGRCWLDAHGESKRGRPSKFTDDRKERLLDAARNGTTVEGCARSAGIGVSTLYDWLNRHPEFSDEFNRARAEAEQYLVDKAAKRNPEWILERSYGYVKTERKEHRVDTDADLSEPIMVIESDGDSDAAE